MRMNTSDARTRKRVKLYMLNEERQWDDKGTGHVSATLVDQDVSLVVVSEVDGSHLLQSKILPDTFYQKQQETLIVWSESESADLALSFQEKSGCDDIWEKICSVQGKDPSVEVTQEMYEDSDGDTETHSDIQPSLSQSHYVELPPADVAHLSEISSNFVSALSVDAHKERVIAALERTNYYKQLVEVFHKVELVDDIESLHYLYDIIRSLIQFNRHAVFDVIFSDEHIMDSIGMLEYNPSRPAKHREFLRSNATFKEVLPIQNKELLAKIHQTYKLQYIQDCCFPPPSLFDENSLSNLSSHIFLNKIEIITTLQDDDAFMNQLFGELVEDYTPLSRKRDLVKFVSEFCNSASSLQPPQKEGFFTTLCQYGALRAMTVLLPLCDTQIKTASLDVLQVFIDNQPSAVREMVLTDSSHMAYDSKLLLNIMIEEMLSDKDEELSDAFLLMNMLKVILDPENMKAEKVEFLSFFYKRCMPNLTRTLYEITNGHAGTMAIPLKDDYRTAMIMYHVLELLTFCVENHTHHMKNYCFNKDLIKHVVALFGTQHKFLTLASVRLIRRVINLKDEFYYRYFIKAGLLKPIVDLLNANGDRYNMLNSALIELFEFIKYCEIPTLWEEATEKYWEDLKKHNYVATFKSVKAEPRGLSDNQKVTLRFGGLGSPIPVVTQNRLGAANPAMDILSTMNASLPSRVRRENRTLEDEEEHWFDQEDEMECESDEGLPTMEKVSLHQLGISLSTPNSTAIPSMSALGQVLSSTAASASNSLSYAITSSAVPTTSASINLYDRLRRSLLRTDSIAAGGSAQLETGRGWELPSLLANRTSPASQSNPGLSGATQNYDSSSLFSSSSDALSGLASNEPNHTRLPSFSSDFALRRSSCTLADVDFMSSAGPLRSLYKQTLAPSSPISINIRSSTMSNLSSISTVSSSTDNSLTMRVCEEKNALLPSAATTEPIFDQPTLKPTFDMFADNVDEEIHENVGSTADIAPLVDYNSDDDSDHGENTEVDTQEVVSEVSSTDETSDGVIENVDAQEYALDDNGCDTSCSMNDANGENSLKIAFTEGDIGVEECATEVQNGHSTTPHVDSSSVSAIGDSAASDFEQPTNDLPKNALEGKFECGEEENGYKSTEAIAKTSNTQSDAEGSDENAERSLLSAVLITSSQCIEIGEGKDFDVTSRDDQCCYSTCTTPPAKRARAEQ